MKIAHVGEAFHKHEVLCNEYEAPAQMIPPRG
jgi:hypothetical protein